MLALAVGLAMDATAVAAATGLAAPVLRARHYALVALCFGGAQAGMPVAGWLLGRSLGGAIAAWDHWIAFVLLGGIGTKLLIEARRAPAAPGDRRAPAAGEPAAPEAEPAGAAAPPPRDPFAPRVLIALSIATSIDALAAGVTLPLLGAPIAIAIATIGVVTAGLAAGGLALGHHAGARLGARLGVAGGVILIGLGTKTLLEHLS